MERKTSQRLAIRRVFREQNRPLSPQEILDGARAFVPGLGIATVYRNLKSLMDEGWLRVVEIPGGGTRYEVGGKPHHHHFHCRGCDGVFELTGCVPAVKELTPPGFLLESHEIVLSGLCPVCAAHSSPN